MRFCPSTMSARLFVPLFALLAISCGTGSSPDWDAKDAHRNCAAAIDAYPGNSAPPCAAMHMCANEARLSDEQRAKLLEMIRATDGCAEP